MRKHRIIISGICFLITLPCLFSCQTTTISSPAPPIERVDPAVVHESGETDLVKLSASMNRWNSLAGPINVDFALINRREKGVYLNHVDKARDIFMGLEGPDCKPVPFTPFGAKQIDRDPYSFNSNRVELLHPGEVMAWRYNLLDYFQLKKSGFYRLRLLRTIDGMEDNPHMGGEFYELHVGPITFWAGDKTKLKPGMTGETEVGSSNKEK